MVPASELISRPKDHRMRQLNNWQRKCYVHSEIQLICFAFKSLNWQRANDNAENASTACRHFILSRVTNSICAYECKSVWGSMSCLMIQPAVANVISVRLEMQLKYTHQTTQYLKWNISYITNCLTISCWIIKANCAFPNEFVVFLAMRMLFYLISTFVSSHFDGCFYIFIWCVFCRVFLRRLLRRHQFV